jgi:hypothetical protein
MDKQNVGYDFQVKNIATGVYLSFISLQTLKYSVSFVIL